tara:strand:- start:19811 stop:20536 length:726 start_codon:yes stop_codon:yes gene_type:complete
METPILNDLIDPDSECINNICKNIIGAKIQFQYTITLKDLKSESGIIENCNIVGDSMENIIFTYLKNKLPTFEKGPKQSSPDFWNRDRKYEWELKVFKNSTGFDISNYISYINQLNKQDGVLKKLYKTQYLIFKYSIDGNNIIIQDFKKCFIWNLISYTGKYPISLQNKKGTWYNIRPCTFSKINKIKSSPSFLIVNILKSISECPNKIENKENIIKNIQLQFNELQLNHCINSLENLKIC